MVSATTARSGCSIMKPMRCLHVYPGRSAQFLKQNVSIKLFAFILIFDFSYLIWTHYPHEQQYRKNSYHPKNLKYLLLWTPDDYSPFYFMGKGQQGFIKKNCSMINCYVTANRNFFGGDLTKFHAIAFNGRNFDGYTKNILPRVRSPHQKYIYVNMESAHNIPVCNKMFNNFFNWTATYRLNSDILYNYITIRDKDGAIVGPYSNMKWIETMDKIDEDLAEKLQNKSKAAAWFVSHCDTKSKRENYVQKLQKALEVYNLHLDIYGHCGKLICPRYRQKDCETLIENDYYFYMALENSFDEDYVTEKLLTAVLHNTVPVVFGGADYSRYLPPGSYLNALKYTPSQLAGLMYSIIQSPKLYQQFFKWKKYYKYATQEGKVQDLVCDTCKALNNKTKFKTVSVYVDLQRWWNTRHAGCD